MDLRISWEKDGQSGQIGSVEDNRSRKSMNFFLPSKLKKILNFLLGSDFSMFTFGQMFRKYFFHDCRSASYEYHFLTFFDISEKKLKTKFEGVPKLTYNLSWSISDCQMQKLHGISLKN